MPNPNSNPDKLPEITLGVAQMGNYLTVAEKYHYGDPEKAKTFLIHPEDMTVGEDVAAGELPPIIIIPPEGLGEMIYRIQRDFGVFTLDHSEVSIQPVPVKQVEITE